MAKQKTALTVADKQQMAIDSRPSYLPAITEDSAINQIEQRGALLPILSLDNNEWSLNEGQQLVKKFEGDELVMFFLHIHYTTQRRAYEGEWDEDNPQDPICLSDDNVIPIHNSPDIQSADGTCKGCWRSQEETRRADKCSYLRNAIVLLEWPADNNDPDGSKIRAIARLRLNGNTLYGEENRSGGEFNAESLVREFKRLQGELWYHPVVAFFDTASKNARNKLLFEVLYEEYPSEDLAAYILEQAKENDYPDMTQLKVMTQDDDESEQQAEQKPAEKAPSQRKAGKKPAAAAKTTNTRSKRGAKADPEPDDSEGSDPAPRSRRAGKKAADTGGEPAAEPDDGAEAAGAGGGDGSVGADDAGGADPLDDPDIADMIGNVELP